LQELYDDFTTLGANDQGILNKIDIWPNPVQDQIQLQIPTEVILQTIEVRNLLGQKQDLEQRGATLEVGHLSSGLYLMRIYTSAGKRVLRFVKE
jgi:hypothetical protein